MENDRYGIPAESAAVIIHPINEDGNMGAALILPEGVSGKQLVDNDLPLTAQYAAHLMNQLIPISEDE